MNHALTRDSYLKYFGMRLALFECLVIEVEAFKPPISHWKLARPRISLMKALATVFFKLASEASLKVVSSKFGLGKLTVVKYIHVIVSHILVSPNMLYLQYVGVQRRVRLREIIDGSEVLSKLPLIMGAIDYTYIPL